MHLIKEDNRVKVTLEALADYLGQDSTGKRLNMFVEPCTNDLVLELIDWKAQNHLRLESLDTVKIERFINRLIKPYKEQIESYCKYKTNKGFFEMVYISLGNGECVYELAQDGKDITDWVYRWPVVCIEKTIKLSLEDRMDGYEKDSLRSLVPQACELLLGYFKKNQEDKFTFVLRQNLIVETFVDPDTKNKYYQLYFRAVKVPDMDYPETVNAVINDRLKYKNDTQGLLKGEGEYINI